MADSKSKPTIKGGYYHIYNRGNWQQDIFLEKDDYIIYLNKLRNAKEKYNISVICYCLMPNHIHLLLRQDADDPIYRFMTSIHTGYSMLFNRKYDKVGHLFQGRYKQKSIDTDEYLLHLSSYIHLNPVIDGLVKKIEDYQWSSYPDYINNRKGTLCDKEIIMRELSAKDYKKILEEESKEKLLTKEFLEALKGQT